LIGKDNDGSSVGGDDIYIGNEKEVVLALLSYLYSELDAISIGVSRPSSCSILHYLLITFNLREEYMILV